MNNLLFVFFFTNFFSETGNSIISEDFFFEISLFSELSKFCKFVIFEFIEDLLTVFIIEFELSIGDNSLIMSVFVFFLLLWVFFTFFFLHSLNTSDSFFCSLI